MAKLDSATILRYEQILEKDPNSQVFAPLAESYREDKQLELAEKLARKGIERHPNFTGGLITLGKILRDLNRKDEALVYLNKVTQIAPDNILAHLISAEIYLQFKRTKEALKSFKMVLLFNPQHEKAQFAVKKLENITADEYDSEVFKISPLNPPDKESTVNPSSDSTHKNPSLYKKSLDRMLSLIDAFIVRNELDKAIQLIKDADSEFGSSPELTKRSEMLIEHGITEESVAGDSEIEDSKIESHNEKVAHSNPRISISENRIFISSRQEQIRKAKLFKLKNLLQRIENIRSI